MISIIIPTYNRAAYLREAMESVLNQTYTDFELIVVDDGSTDATHDVIRSVLHAADRSVENEIRYIRTPHRGVSAARNRGIQEAAGEWIAFLDSDDFWLPEKLDKQITYLSNNRPGHPEHDRYLLCHTNEVWLKNGKVINQGKKHAKYEGWFFKPSLELCLISPSSVLIHRKVFSKVGTFDESFEYVEDYDLWLRITSSFPAGYVDQKLIVKRGGHADQLSAKIDGIEKYRILALDKIISGGSLGTEHLDAALETYRKKTAIYLNGCRKRKKWREMENLQRRSEVLLNQFSKALAN